MNKFTKKSAFGITTVAAATALVAGFAAPAMASTGHDGSFGGGTDKVTKTSSTSNNTSDTSSSTSNIQDRAQGFRDLTSSLFDGDTSTSNWSPVEISPTIGIGDVASGNAVGSGNDVPLLSGNDTAAGNEDGNGNSTGNGDAVGNNDATSSIKGLVDGILNGNSASGKSSSSSNSSKSITSDVMDSLGLSSDSDR